MAAWHAFSAGLLLVTLTTYFIFVRRVLDLRSAGLATACAALLAAWGVLSTWLPGVQDLWMLVFSMGFLLAVVSGHRGWAAGALAGALLSKETAVILPAVAVAWHALVERRSWREILRETGLHWAITLLWATLYLAIAAQWLQSAPAPAALEKGSVLGIIGRAVLAVINLDVWPRPQHGWKSTIGMALIWTFSLLLLTEWCRRSNRKAGSSVVELPAHARGVSVARSRSGVMMFGLCWVALGLAPLLHPSLHWHSYYSVFTSLGAWLSLSIVLGRLPGLTPGLILFLALLRVGRSLTPIPDWGEESYVRRAGQLLDAMRNDLQTKVVAPAAHTRLYFHRVPSGAGFMIGDGPSLRIWYHDSTLSGGFWRDFRARAKDSAVGPDRFFRYDSLSGWIEVHSGPEDVLTERRRNPDWVADHVRLSSTLSAGEDWKALFSESVKLSEALPSNPTFPYMAGLAAIALGDSGAAKFWISRAARAPGADAEIHAVARALGVVGSSNNGLSPAR